MKKILAALLLTTSILQAQMETLPTENPNLTFFIRPSDGGTQKPAVIGALNKEQEIIWGKSMAMASAIKIQPSPDGRYLAVLSGESREGMAYPSLPDSQNTLYILNGQSGAILSRVTPLQNDPSTKWADDTWQNLNLKFIGENLTIYGNIFSNPNHPQKEPFRKSYNIGSEEKPPATSQQENTAEDTQTIVGTLAIQSNGDENYLTITSQTPVKITTSENKTVVGRTLQITGLPEDEQTKAEAISGQRVQIQGKLMEAQSSQHKTSIIILTREINPL